ncbi:S4 domain-containing protein [Heyndrickxia oleronia]|uniref:S4 domain-containing protein n=1 Tax=Heyndrickxia oleronia TaxID=38875 RepID=UPI0003AA1261|nr:S4 domain-containing protein [Heyndrickxia oleronia]GIN37835.1 hypothetical protein J19TS1_07840 [Heyndrickxia oleronia]
MNVLDLSWNLVEQSMEKVITRYCKNCGKTVGFKDSLIRRHNSNGKNIYRYAIFKCPKDHTWNQKLSIYKAYTEHAKVREELIAIENDSKYCLQIESLREQGYTQIRIKINQAYGAVRLDKMLAESLEGWSRTEIVKKIKNNEIQVNDKVCKPSQKLIKSDYITVIIT